MLHLLQENQGRVSSSNYKWPRSLCPPMMGCRGPAFLAIIQVSSSGHSRCLSASTPAPGSTTLYLYRGYCQHSLLIAPLLHFLMPGVQHKRWGLIAITLRVVVILSLRALIISRHLGWLSLICHKIHIVIREIHTHQNSHRISVPTFILLCLQEFPPWILSRWLSLARGWKRCILLPSTQMTLG